MNDVRLIATQTINRVLRQQASLASLMGPAQQQVEERDQALLQALCFGTLRWQPQLQSILGRLLEKPLKDKDTDIQALLLLGLYQLLYTRIPDHAAISATVNVSKLLKKVWASKLVNGVLRQFVREREALEAQLANSPAYVSAHPNWLRKEIETSWPQQAAAVFTANNLHPPFTLRVNRRQHSRDDYIQSLQAAGFDASPCQWSADAIQLPEATDVTRLPGFAGGSVSVQDEAAQLAAGLLQLQAGQRVLDACCAPGGKTCHMAETEAALEIIAIDVDAQRLQRVEANLQRLQLQAEVVCADVGAVDSWWDGQTFDRILLDAPCSATGVIRRHPDIKLLRKPADIAKLAALQLQLLHALWPTLKPGGLLVYATCSVLPQENTRVVARFLQEQPAAVHEPIVASWGLEQPCGRQLLPQAGGHDGFYYACLRKAGS